MIYFILAGLVCFFTALVLLIREINATKKKKELNAAIHAVTAPLTTNLTNQASASFDDFEKTGDKEKESTKLKGKFNRIVGEPVIVGAGAGGYSLFDIYYTAHDKKQILKIIEERFPVMMKDASPFDWFTKFSELENHGTRSVQTYIDAYVGKAAEHFAVNSLESQGYIAKEFGSQTYHDDDIRVWDNNGKYLYDVSVKSYGGDTAVSNFQQIVENHPDSTHYIVNSELYDKLSQNGMIDRLHEQQGIIIDNGSWSHTELVLQGQDTVQSMVAAGDVAHHVPFISIALLGFKTFRNIDHYFLGKESSSELATNVLGDTARIFVASTAAIKFGTIGAGVGTGVVPGIGTIVGGVAGAVVGGIAASAIVEWAKEEIKWGNIIKAIEYFGSKSKSGLDAILKRIGSKQIGCFPDIVRDNEKAQTLLSKYEREVNPYKKDKITIPGILAKLDYEKTVCELEAAYKAVGEGFTEVQKLCDEVANTISKGKDDKKVKISNRLLGQVIFDNFNVSDTAIGSKEKKLIEKYNSQINRNPNHPYRLKMQVEGKEISSKEIFESYVMAAYAKLYRGFNFEYTPAKYVMVKVFSILGIMSIIVGLIFGSGVIGMVGFNPAKQLSKTPTTQQQTVVNKLNIDKESGMTEQKTSKQNAISGTESTPVTPQTAVLESTPVNPPVTSPKVIRGWLGVGVKDITPEIAKNLKLKETSGAMVENVIPGGPAEKAGVKKGDIIIAIGDKKIENKNELILTIFKIPVGERIVVTVFREGTEKQLLAIVEERPKSEGVR